MGVFIWQGSQGQGLIYWPEEIYLYGGEQDFYCPTSCLFFNQYTHLIHLNNLQNGLKGMTLVQDRKVDSPP